jgi:hypothetical protein
MSVRLEIAGKVAQPFVADRDAVCEIVRSVSVSWPRVHPLVMGQVCCLFSLSSALHGHITVLRVELERGGLSS